MRLLVWSMLTSPLKTGMMLLNECWMITWKNFEKCFGAVSFSSLIDFLNENKYVVRGLGSEWYVIHNPKFHVACKSCQFYVHSHITLPMKKKKVVMNHDNIKLHYYNFASSFWTNYCILHLLQLWLEKWCCIFFFWWFYFNRMRKENAYILMHDLSI